MMSPTSTVNATIQKSRRPSAALFILFLLLAGDAEPGVGQRIEPLEGDLLPALMALAEAVGLAVEPPQRLVHVPEVTALLRREEELLLPLHGVGPLVRHVKGVGREVAVGRLQRVIERLVVVPELLHHAGPFVEQALLEMLQLLLGHDRSLVDKPLHGVSAGWRRTAMVTW